MGYSDIIYEVEDALAVITLNRPAKLNAWTPTMESEFRDALGRADGDSSVRAIVVTGTGRGFCAGADMGTLSTIADAGRNERADAAPSTGTIEDNYRQNFSFPLAIRKPIVGAINGAAVGLGMVVTLYFDVRVASDQARFGTAFATLGLVAEHGISWLLPRAVGMANALDLLYSARIIGADEALRMGLVTKVVPHDELLPATKEYARRLVEKSSPRAMARIKRLTWDAQFQDLATATQAANRAMAESFTDPDFKEGLAAFAEKRPALFAGLGS